MDVLAQRGQSWICQEVLTVRAVLRHFQVIAAMLLHQVLVYCDRDGVGTLVALELAVDYVKIFPDFDGGVLRMVAV